MGAATVLMATGGALPRQVKAAVSDCAYTSIEVESRHVLSRFQDVLPTKMPLPAGLLFAVLRRTVLRRAGFDLRDAGVEDDFVPASMMGKLYQAARCPKAFLWVPGAGHAQAVGTDPDLYWTAAATFLQDYFPEKSE